MPDTESAVKGRLVKVLRTTLPPGFVVLRHEDRITAGIPDMSIAGNRIDTWWEVKLADPYVRHRGAQDLTMLRLARQSRAAYIIYEDRKGRRQTWIVEPAQLAQWEESAGQPGRPGFSTDGFDHRWVSDHIMHLHGHI